MTSNPKNTIDVIGNRIEEKAGNDKVNSPAPRALADKYLADVHPEKTLQWWRGEWWIYKTDTGWNTIDEVALKAVLSESIKDWWYIHETPKGEEEIRTIYARLKEGLLRDVIGQIRQPKWSMLLPERGDAPMWLNGKPGAREYLPLKNGILHFPTRELRKHTPELFHPNRLDFPFEKENKIPARWMNFVHELWPDDPDSIALLQEIFGYYLSGDTRLQKAVMLIGPKRSGKGTIARIIGALLGAANICAPTLGSLAENFGLQCIIGKQLAIIGDARLSGRQDGGAVVDKLLSVVGEDSQTIHSKYLAPWEGFPKCRFMLLSNEFPRFPDSSGAIASRFLLLQTSNSFYGKEDHGLFDALLGELPAIFNWALDGLDRLNERGRFPELASAAEAMQEFEHLSSPISAFLQARCEVHPELSVHPTILYRAYREWCEEEGITHIPTKFNFGKDLRAVIPNLERPRRLTDAGKREYIYIGLRVV
jgi:putative DNA primase/helicase